MKYVNHKNVSMQMCLLTTVSHHISDGYFYALFYFYMTCKCSSNIILVHMRLYPQIIGLLNVFTPQKSFEEFQDV